MMGGCLGGMGWGWLAMIGILLFWVAVVLLVVYAIRGFGQGARTTASGGPAADGALAVLRERYARGEINREEYEERRRALADDAFAI